MSEANKDAGVIQVMAEQLANTRLPRALEMKERVDRGERLSQWDIDFLEQVFRDAHEFGPMLATHPEWHDLAGRVVNLYKEITAKALENEQQAKGG
jgi:hypothetical protein